MRIRSKLLLQLEEQQRVKHDMEENIRAVTAELTDLTSCLAPVCCVAPLPRCPALICYNFYMCLPPARLCGTGEHDPQNKCNVLTRVSGQLRAAAACRQIQRFASCWSSCLCRCTPWRAGHTSATCGGSALKAIAIAPRFVASCLSFGVFL